MQDIASPRVHTAANLPAQAISEEVLIEKYAKGAGRLVFGAMSDGMGSQQRRGGGSVSY